MKNKIFNFFYIVFFVYQSYAFEMNFDSDVVFVNGSENEEKTDFICVPCDDGSMFYGTVNRNGGFINGLLSNLNNQLFYNGSFDENEEYSGKSILDTPRYHYEGEFKNGLFHGYGIFFDKINRRCYEGFFLEGKKNGYGKEYGLDSDYCYEGCWKEDLHEGEGTLVTDSGEKYHGNFAFGKISGYGERITSKGEILKGNWKNATTLSGEHCSVYSDICYTGEIVDGKYEGYGTYVDNNGFVYEGTFAGCQMTGLGQEVFPDGSVYTGYLYGNQRNGYGSFSFSNEMQYEGGFLNGTFYGTGYLSSTINNELTIIASDEWDGTDIPKNIKSESSNNCTKEYVSRLLPKKGKILFSNGDMWEGCLINGVPVIGTGIWTTRNERITLINKKKEGVFLASYKINDNIYDLSSVYSQTEIVNIINSEKYLINFLDFYREHKETIDNIVGGLQVATSILSIVPSPIQGYAKITDIGLSLLQISLKSIDSADKVYNACISGNVNLIGGIIFDYGKDVAWDAINIIFATGGSGLGKFSKKNIEGMERAERTISGIVGKAVSKNKTLAYASKRLTQLGKVGKDFGKAIIESTENSGFFRFVAKNGGKLTKTVKTGWIKTVYPKLFAKYGDDATRLLFKYGNRISEQLAKNGDVIVKAAKSNGDDIARIFIKNGDEIAKVARASEYPDAVIKYIKNSSNIDDALKMITKNPALGKVVEKYGDDAIKCIEKYGDDVIKVLEKNGDQFTKALKKLPPEKHYLVLKFFTKHSDEAGTLYAKYQDSIIDLYEKAGTMRQDKLIKAIDRDGDKAISALNSASKAELRKALDIMDDAATPEIGNAIKYAEKTKLGKVVGDNQQDFVYRVIRSDENPKVGLSAKNPNRNMSIDGHVRTGSRNNGSQYISTTTDLNVAKKWAEQDGCKIVKVDLTKLSETVDIYDLSIKEGQELYLKGLTQNFANASKEVLLKGYIPPTAITVM